MTGLTLRAEIPVSKPSDQITTANRPYQTNVVRKGNLKRAALLTLIATLKNQQLNNNPDTGSSSFSASERFLSTASHTLGIP
jgi:hypothetical protein